MTVAEITQLSHHHVQLSSTTLSVAVSRTTTVLPSDTPSYHTHSSDVRLIKPITEQYNTTSFIISSASYHYCFFFLHWTRW